MLWLLFVKCFALYVYTNPRGQHCFYEELSENTHVAGHRKVEAEDESVKAFSVDNNLVVHVSVYHMDHVDTPIISQDGDADAQFAFTASKAGKHKICIEINPTNNFVQKGRVRLHIDFTIGETSENRATESKASDLLYRVQELLNKAVDIKREQRYQREREAQFRDLSELVNSRIVGWTIVQFCVIAITCVWQLRHLKTFFNAKKIV